MELILSDEEQEFLVKLLEQRHRELSLEISHTDRREFRRELTRDEELLESLVCRLRGVAVQGSRG
jgi:hypothetical protein